MNLAQLRALVAVAEHGGFTRAAVVLGLTQSAVSHAVAGLERELGHALLHRDRSGVVVTAVGRTVLDDARQAVRAADRVAAQAEASGAQLVGELRLGGLPSTNVAVLPALQREFCRRYPQARVSLLEGSDEEVLDWTEHGLVDLGCVTEAVGKVDGALLATDEFMAVMDIGHPLAGQDGVAVGELADDPLITSASGCEPVTEQLFHEAGLPFRPRHRATQLRTILTMISLGMGVSIMPSLLLAELPRDVVAVPLRPAVPRRIWLGHPPGARPHALAQAFLAHVRETG
ncbi:MAG: LysR family transcriptional regulator [Jiangellaceae bacterium]